MSWQTQHVRGRARIRIGEIVVRAFRREIRAENPTMPIWTRAAVETFRQLQRVDVLTADHVITVTAHHDSTGTSTDAVGVLVLRMVPATIRRRVSGALLFGGYCAAMAGIALVASAAPIGAAMTVVAVVIAWIGLLSTGMFHQLQGRRADLAALQAYTHEQATNGVQVYLAAAIAAQPTKAGAGSAVLRAARDWLPAGIIVGCARTPDLARMYRDRWGAALPLVEHPTVVTWTTTGSPP